MMWQRTLTPSLLILPLVRDGNQTSVYSTSSTVSLYKFSKLVPQGVKEENCSKCACTHNEIPAQRTSAVIPPMMFQTHDGYQPTIPTDLNPFLLYSGCSVIFPASP